MSGKLTDCRGKIGHETLNRAERHLSNLRRKTPGYGGHIYVCPKCMLFHVGRKMKEIRRAIKRKQREEGSCPNQTWKTS